MSEDTARTLADIQFLLRDNTVGEISPQDARDFLLSVFPQAVTLTASATLTSAQTVVLCDATAGDITVTLPRAEREAGRRYNIKKIDGTGNAVIIDGDGSETVDGELTVIIDTQYDAATIVSDGTEWIII